MIENDQQYQITKAQAQKLRQAEQDALESQRESLQAEVTAYEGMVNGQS